MLSQRTISSPHTTLAQILADVQLMSPRDVERTVGLKAITLIAMAVSGQFPRPIVMLRDKGGRPRKRAWRATEVREWIEARSNERD